jgi:hypothetical protein
MRKRERIETKCPHCGETLDSHVGISDPFRPTSTTATMCCYCRKISIFDDHRQLRKPTQTEQAEIDAQHGRMFEVLDQAVARTFGIKPST